MFTDTTGGQNVMYGETNVPQNPRTALSNIVYLDQAYGRKSTALSFKKWKNEIWAFDYLLYILYLYLEVWQKK